MPCNHYRDFYEPNCRSCYSKDKKDVKKLNAYLAITNILNFKYCSFTIVDKEKDMLKKIIKIINEVENDNTRNI